MNQQLASVQKHLLEYTLLLQLLSPLDLILHGE